MSRVTFQSKSASEGIGTGGAPPPPPPPPVVTVVVMTGGRTGRFCDGDSDAPDTLPSWLTETSMVSSASSSESVTAMIVTLTDLPPAGSVTT